MEKTQKKEIILEVTAVVLATVMVMWFLTPVPTVTARFFWDQYHMGELALAFDRTDAPLAFDIGNYTFGLGSYDLSLAEWAFRKAVSIDPGILYGHYQLARVLFVKGDLSQAAAEIDAELTYNPANLRALYVRGLIRAYNRDLAGAASDFERFTEWAPSEWAGYNDLAWILGQERKYAEAKAVLERGFRNAAAAAENPWLWNNLGVQQLNLKEYKDAVASFSKAKTLAASLDERSWKSAYPGNDPSGSTGGIQAFQTAIEKNLERARSGFSQ